jgi:cardiolipin synthase A/B
MLGFGSRSKTRRPIDASNRGARRGAVGSGSGSMPTLARVGSIALKKSEAPLDTREHALAATVSGTLFGISLLGARFPRLLALPLAAVGMLYGGLRVVRSALYDRT